ncbi:ferric reductase-like transmembrane domain-containing protein [Pseudomonas sp. UL073]|uniref:Ferric reductase-like transmembrane domain-containing protein n=1 Tax=Zestomonas insulae TaxID=2809017 RepID=A0ABS2IIA4_9GAMM|nr:ferric reductase-like transmembrane domain-containing protein [Pseudomonas insulae]MBM7062801.1 ferric reductase-like transmembrane domain-containing protein [Pseudomonas insulae]
MVVLSLRIALFCLLPFAVLLLLDAVPGVALAWDFANAAGLLAALLMLLLFVLTGRPLRRPHHDGKFFQVLHRDLGFAAIVLLAVHIGVLLYDEPLTLDYLLPSAPGYMLAGLGATLLLLLIAPLSLIRVRRKLWRDHRHFKRWHYAASLLLIGLLAWHVLGAGFYLHSTWKIALWGLLSVALLIWPRLPRDSLERSSERRRRTTAPLATRLSLAVALGALLCAGLFAVLANSDLPL